MGVDLMGVGLSYNWSSWHALHGLGVAFGWRPTGTLKPKNPGTYEFEYPADDDPGPRGGYFSNDFYCVTDADAAAWAAALYRALDAMAGKSAMTADEAEMVRKAITGDLGWTLPITPEQMEALTAALDEDGGGEPLRAVGSVNSDIEDMVREFAESAERRGFCIG
jgi:hypothetical protein